MILQYQLLVPIRNLFIVYRQVYILIVCDTGRDVGNFSTNKPVKNGNFRCVDYNLYFDRNALSFVSSLIESSSVANRSSHNFRMTASQFEHFKVKHRLGNQPHWNKHYSGLMNQAIRRSCKKNGKSKIHILTNLENSQNVSTRLIGPHQRNTT